MVRGQHQQQRIGAVAGGFEGCDRDCRRRVAANRFQDDGRRLGADLLQLLGSDKAVLLVGDHQRAMRGDRRHPFPSGLQHRQFARQRQELLRVRLARQRPQAGPGATGQNDGLDDAHGRP